MSNDLKSMYSTVVDDQFPDTLTITLGDQTLTYAKRTWSIDGEVKGLRYGENPDQPAALYAPVEGCLISGGVEFCNGKAGLVSTLTEEQMIQAGKHPGKTNLTDVDNGVNILQYLAGRPAAVILKHNNPSGAAWSKEGVADALSKAFWCDRIAAFGGAVVVNRPLSVPAARLIADNYFEVVAAPDYEAGALELIKARKNLRILRIPGLATLDEDPRPFLDIKSLTDGGLVLQRSFVNRIRKAGDFLPAQGTDKSGETAIARAPTPGEADDLLFAWAVEAGVTSNSVIFARNGATVAIGTGEQDRVGVVSLTIYKAYTKYMDTLSFSRHNLSIHDLIQKAATDPECAAWLEAIDVETKRAKGGLPGSVLVSDGFFPFRDGVDLVMRQGVTAIAQPGGSLRDVEVIKAVNEHSPQVGMVFTGQRSFRH